MKILLINPPKINSLESPETCRIEKQEGSYSPVGLLYIASYLLQSTNYEVEIIDAQIENLDYASIKKEIQKRKPDLVGITATSFTITDAFLTARVAKSVDKDIHVKF